MTTPQPPIAPGSGATPSPTRPTETASGDWLARALRPRVVLSLLAVVMVIAVILTPDTGAGSLDVRLTTYSTGPASAKGLYEVTHRIGVANDAALGAVPGAAGQQRRVRRARRARAADGRRGAHAVGGGAPWRRARVRGREPHPAR